MHRALLIEEILLNIFGHYDTLRETVNVSDVALLARTCRAFKEPALDVLWADLCNLSPLAQCLPDASHKLSPDENKRFAKQYSFSRALTRTEWDILQSYTRRIRRILNFSLGLDEESLDILSNPPTTEPLFPNLCWLHCRCKAKPVHLLYFPLPSLKFLHVNFENPHASQDYLKLLPEFSLDIECLSIDVSRGDLAFSKVVSNCVCRLQNLRTVICPLIPLDVDALAHLSGIPALTRLNFGLSTTLSLSESTHFFSNLHDLVLRSELLDPISQFLSQTRLPGIIDFVAVVSGCPSRHELSFFLTNVQTSNAHHTMEEFTFHQMSLERNVRSEAHLLCLEDLQPCMAFSNLVYLELNIEWNVGLTDSDLLTLTSAWPQLEYLFINLDSGWNRQGRITPSGLLQLLQMCRSLVEVALAIDTQGYTESHLSVSLANLGLVFPPKLYLNVLDSIIEAESVPAVTTFFAGIASYSKLSFSAWHGEKMVKPRGWRIYRKRWADVFRRANDAACQRSRVLPLLRVRQRPSHVT